MEFMGGPSPYEANDPDEEFFASRASWLYFVEEMTQSEIASTLGATRFKINRTLADARRSGLVQIHINSDSIQEFKVATEMKKAFGLRDAIIVPTPEDRSRVHISVGAGLGWYISTALRDDSIKTFGLGWGQTLRESIQFIRPRQRSDAMVTALLGALNRPNEINSFEIIYRFSRMIGADRYYLTAPMYTTSTESRVILQAQDFYQDFRKLAVGADLGCFAVGAINSGSTLIREGLPSNISPESILESGAVGDLLGTFIDIEGNPVGHRINRQLVGLSLAELTNIKTLALASGGLEKVDAIVGALRTGIVNVLITDAETAAAVLRRQAQRPAEIAAALRRK